MLRFLLLVSVCLSALFTLVGAVLSREWGWSEYASDELYVVYYEKTVPFNFFILNTDGSGDLWELSMNSETITDINCSPDGNVLAFMTESPHLYVLDRSGIRLEQSLEAGGDSTKISVTNNGNVVYRPEPIIKAHIIHLLNLPDRHRNSEVVTWLATMIWEVDLDGIRLTQPGLNNATFFPGADKPEWIVSEDFFAINATSGFPGVNRLLIDIGMLSTVAIPEAAPFGIFSPDATKQVFNRLSNIYRESRIYISDAFSKDGAEQISFIDSYHHEPLCFLTFRPEMLIDQSS